ncbi:MAG: FkbM family methyltransferase [Hyphomicrobiales bacterium]
MFKFPSSIRKRVFRTRDRVIIRQTPYGAYVLDPRDQLDLNMAAGRVPERNTFAELRKRVTAFQPDLFLDIGSNFGLYAILAGTMGVGEVHAFEPVRRKYDQICGSIAANRFSDRVRAHHMAVGAEEGTAVMHLVPGLSAVSRFEDATDGAVWDFTERQEVRVAAIDDLFDWSGRKAFVKIDVEGAESGVLAGMEGFLQRNRVDLQIEIFPQNSDAVYALMERFGYTKTGQVADDHYFASPAR